MIDKNWKETTKTISYKFKTDAARFMVRLSSNLVDNLGKGIHKVICKHRHDSKKCETSEIKYKDYECCLEYTNVKNDLIL